MEANIKINKKAFFLLIFLSLINFNLFCQKTNPQKIRLKLWALQDAYPEIKENKPYEQANISIKNLSYNLLQAMTYGLSFTYTPYDKMRKVDEFFEVKELHSFEDDKKNVTLEDFTLTEDKVYYWLNFTKTQQMNYYYNNFNSVKNPIVKGSGKGSVYEGFTGLEFAINNSIKNGIREYYRKIIKNKPKEITGSILVKNVSAIYIESGNYVVELDFFLETSKIKEYNYF